MLLFLYFVLQIPSLKRLEEGYDNISNLLTYTEELVDGNNQNIYDIETGVENVTKKHDEIEEIIQTEVVDRIMRIRFNIERGREKIRNLAGVAAEYDRTTSAELKIPEVAYGPSIRTRVSFDFKSAQSNALLLFLGNSEEYMAFEIDDGYLQVVYANGPDKRKVVNKNSRVNQNGWTKVQLKK